MKGWKQYYMLLLAAMLLAVLQPLNAGAVYVPLTEPAHSNVQTKVQARDGTSAAEKPSQSQVYKTIIEKKKTYPEGMQWTNDNYYAWKGGIYSAGYGCAAFAFMLSDIAFGTLPARTHENYDDIRAGDILRLYNDSHSVIVLEVSGDTVTLAEGNYNGEIHWGRTMTLEDIKENCTYVMTRY